MAHPGDQSLGARLRVLARAEDRHDHVLRHELEVDVVQLAHQRSEPEPGAARAPDVDREAQRIPAVDSGAPDEPLVEHV